MDPEIPLTIDLQPIVMSFANKWFGLIALVIGFFFAGQIVWRGAFFIRYYLTRHTIRELQFDDQETKDELEKLRVSAIRSWHERGETDLGKRSKKFKTERERDKFWEEFSRKKEKKKTSWLREFFYD